MGRLIDEDDVLKALDKIFPADPMRNDFTQGITCGAALAKEYIKQLPSAEQRWIPWYSGRLPEESGTYTVTAYDGATKRVTYAKYQKRLKQWELTGARAYWRVVAWMPLPEPYKEGNDGTAD